MYSLKFRLNVFLAICILAFLLITGSIIALYNSHLENSVALIKKSNLMSKYTLEAQIHFKRQVQEWKNILLRGHEPKLLKKYFSQFENEKKLIKSNINSLLPLIKDNKELTGNVDEFITLHKYLDKKYFEALQIYYQTEKQPYFKADKHVQGIDRRPSQLLDELVIAIQSYSAQQEKLLDKNFNYAQSFAIALSIISSIVMAIVFLYVLRKLIFRPICNLSNSMHIVTSKEKDLTQRLEDTNCIEFFDITNNFNQFVEEIHNMLVEIRAASVNLKNASFLSARVTEDTRQSIHKQNQDISNLNNSMKSMTGSIDNVASLSSEASKAANVSSESATMGNHEVEQIKSLISVLSDNVEDTSNEINELTTQFQSINSISDMISSISEQTSLLSLNAAIEAARAGESGRGFAVVADEVRSLAVKTNEATQQIKDTIDLIQLKSSKSLNTIEQSNKIAAECRSQSSRVESAFKNIIQSIQIIVVQNQSIKKSSSEQQSLVNHVTKHIEEIEHDLDVTTKGTTQNTSDNSDLAQLSIMLQSLIHEFKVLDDTNTEELESEECNVDLF